MSSTTYMKYHYLLLCLLFFGLPCLAQTEPKEVVKPPIKLLTNEDIFPFRFNETNARFDIMINLNDPNVISKYKSLFKKHKLKFEGYTWQEVVSQIMEKVDPYLNRDVDYMDGDDELYISTKGKKAVQEAYLKDMLMVLLNRDIMDAYLKKLDRSRLEEDDEPEATKVNGGND